MTATNGRARRIGLVEQVIELLQARLGADHWPVGTRLPVEDELAREFGVSRITLRQAVQALVHVGQLETIQGSGTFVRAASEVEAVVSRFLSTKDLRSVLEVRQALESQAAALAAGRAIPAQLAQMGAAIERGEHAAAAGDLLKSSEASIDFHRTVVAASHNAPLISLYTGIQNSVLQSIHQAAPADEARSFVDGHREILDAIAGGDADGARHLASEHLRHVIDRFDAVE
ncbi:FadR/GntR family transcriptional regulator [Gordonia sp. DT30]|uniref:FadR/GntR family transcriptional regulator n=1 Tax=unclassified Gordonia (in: high G+C Gram-positive bacteria) TaxID=2657482 RepID=UPI003CF67EB6